MKNFGSDLNLVTITTSLWISNQLKFTSFNFINFCLNKVNVCKLYNLKVFFVFLHIFIAMDDHSNQNRVNGASNHMKSYTSATNMPNNGAYQPQPRMSYNAAYTHSNKDLPTSK